jgi:hypothetical protein
MFIYKPRTLGNTRMLRKRKVPLRINAKESTSVDQKLARFIGKRTKID